MGLFKWKGGLTNIQSWLKHPEYPEASRHKVSQRGYSDGSTERASQDSGYRITARIQGACLDPDCDAYIIPRENPNPEEAPNDVYLSQMITVQTTSIKVWPIGSGSWIWDELGCRRTALGIAPCPS